MHSKGTLRKGLIPTKKPSEVEFVCWTFCIGFSVFHWENYPLFVHHSSKVGIGVLLTYTSNLIANIQ